MKRLMVRMSVVFFGAAAVAAVLLWPDSDDATSARRVAPAIGEPATPSGTIGSLAAGTLGDRASAAAPGRSLVLHGPNGATLLLGETKDGGIRDRGVVQDLNEHILRSGTCARPGQGVAWHISDEGVIRGFDFDTFRRGTFAIESRKQGALTPAFCVEHRGPIALKFKTTRTPRIFARVRATASGTLFAHAMKRSSSSASSVDVTLKQVRGGAATQFVINSSAGGSFGAAAHLRAGTCRARPASSAVIALAGMRPAPVIVPISFASFGRGRWVVEVLYEADGADIAQCIGV